MNVQSNIDASKLLNSAKDECGGLLWRSSRWPPDIADDEKLLEIHQLYHPAVVSAVIAGGAVTHIAGPKFDNTLKFGMMRRAEMLRNASLILGKVVWPGRTIRMTQSEHVNLEMALQTIYVNSSGLIDCVVLAFCEACPTCDQLPLSQRTLREKKFRQALGNDTVKEIFKEFDPWLRHLKQIRDRFVHRVPPYVPPMLLNDEQSSRFLEIETMKPELISANKLDELERLEREQSQLGSFVPLLVLSDIDQNVPLLSTILEDLLTAFLLKLKLLQVLEASFFRTDSDN